MEKMKVVVNFIVQEEVDIQQLIDEVYEAIRAREQGAGFSVNGIKEFEITEE